MRMYDTLPKACRMDILARDSLFTLRGWRIFRPALWGFFTGADENIRRATLRISDAIRLVCLWYPVRCRACGTRQFVRTFRALRLARAPRTAPVRDRKSTR